MGRQTQKAEEKKVEEFKKTEDVTEHEEGEKTGMEYSEQDATRTDTGQTHQETESERRQREAAEQRSTTTGGTIGKEVGRTETGQETENRYGWGEAMPETERIKALDKSIAEIGEGPGDPSIPFREARAKQDALRMMDWSGGAFTSPETRRAITQQLFSQIGQQAGQDYLTQAYNRTQQKLQGTQLQAQLAQYMAPKRELLGSKAVGTTTGTTDTTQQNTQNTISNTLSEMFGVDKSYSDTFSKNLMESLQSNFGVDFSSAITDAQRHGASAGTSTGTSTRTESSPFNWGSLLGGLLGVAA